MSVYLNQIPGYKEALAKARGQEYRAQEDNWLDFPSRIAGLKVRPMTVQDYVVLLRIASPFLLRTEPSFEDLGLFLWILSPEIARWHKKRFHTGEKIHAWFYGRKVRSILKIRQLENQAAEWFRQNPGKPFILPAECDLSRAIVQAFKYIDRMFMERPASMAKEGNGSGIFYLCSWFDAMQSEYRMTDEDVWTMPIPRLFGRLKAITARKNPSEPEFNSKKDELVSRLQRAMQQKTVSENDLLAGRFNFEN